MNEYIPTIGIEVHAELKTKTKMFCTSRNAPHESEPNIHVCPVCMGHPGTLPVINKEAVKCVLAVGYALKGSLATYTEFDRKNYFYPDIPKGYQISQYEHPLVSGGELAGVAITRVHLEEDTARSLHDQGSGSSIDYNRAGVPLMELVTEPVIHDAKTAGNFARELQLLLRTIGVSDANMEKGEMRVEANISISKTDKLGTKVEVKNLNSFKVVESAITYEIKRQKDVLEKGERVVQETRGWDENRDKTFSQRSKETSEEYRYFPDPDLPALDLSRYDELSLQNIAKNKTKTPTDIRETYANLGLSREATEVLLSNQDARILFDSTMQHIDAGDGAASKVANYIMTDALSFSTSSRTLAEANSKSFAELMTMVIGKEITSRVAKDMLQTVLYEDIDPREYAKEHGLLQSSSEDDLAILAEKIVTGNASVVEEYRNGKEASLQFLVGQGMKETRGSANPILLAELLKKRIG